MAYLARSLSLHTNRSHTASNAARHDGERWICMWTSQCSIMCQLNEIIIIKKKDCECNPHSHSKRTGQTPFWHCCSSSSVLSPLRGDLSRVRHQVIAALCWIIIFGYRWLLVISHHEDMVKKSPRELLDITTFKLCRSADPLPGCHWSTVYLFCFVFH